MKISYVPAVSGWYLIGPISEYGEIISVYYEPIIAWEIKTTIYHDRLDETTTFVNPVSIEGCVRENADFAVKRPDGSMVVLDSHELKDEDDAISFFKEEYKNKHKSIGRPK